MIVDHVCVHHRHIQQFSFRVRETTHDDLSDWERMNISIPDILDKLIPETMITGAPS